MKRFFIALLVIVVFLMLVKIQPTNAQTCQSTSSFPVIGSPNQDQSFTNGQTMTFLGYVVNNCNNPISPTAVYYFANNGNFWVTCSQPIQLGANVYSCDTPVSSAWPQGYYNVHMLTIGPFNHAPAFTTINNAFKKI